jgi:hypothetical protein
MFHHFWLLRPVFYDKQVSCYKYEPRADLDRVSNKNHIAIAYEVWYNMANVGNGGAMHVRHAEVPLKMPKI